VKILIIGNGFIASQLIQRLNLEDNKILVLSRCIKKDIKCEQIAGDIFSFDIFKLITTWNPQVIIHTAWVTTYELYKNDQSNFKYARFTQELAEIISKTDTEHLIVLGSCAEYGTQYSTSSAGVTKLSPTNTYAQQKVLALNSIKEILLKSNKRLSWARIFHPYGPGQDRQRLIPYLINSVKENKNIELNNTTTCYDWITTRDIASAISWIINHKTPVETDIGTGVGYTNPQLLNKIENFFGVIKQTSTYNFVTSGKNEVSVADPTSPLFESGWSPTDNLITGLKWVNKLN
jgi:nucleoside-diphosphate-sugar epimerase